VQESFGLTYNYEDKDPESWLNSNFPARYIYEKVSAYTALPLCQSAAALTKDLRLAAARCCRCRKPSCAVSPRKSLGRWPENVEHYCR
jgi:hypothetical protein